MRRWIVLLVLWPVLLYSCAGNPAESPSPEPETPLAIVGGVPVLRAEVEASVVSVVRAYAYALYREIDWDGMEDGVPMREYFLRQALDMIVTNHVTDKMAVQMGYGLTEEEEEAIDWIIANEIENYGGSEAFLQYLATQSLNEELYRYYGHYLPKLREKMLREAFGNGGAYAPDEESIRAYYEINFVNTLYLSVYGTDEEGIPLEGEALEERVRFVEDLRQQALAKGSFKTIVAEHGRDYTMFTNPNGLPISLNGSMGIPVSVVSALPELGENEISDVVIADNIYLVQRLPINWEWFEQNEEEVWYLCASDLFAELTESGKRDTVVSETDEFWRIDPFTLYE